MMGGKRGTGERREGDRRKSRGWERRGEGRKVEGGIRMDRASPIFFSKSAPMFLRSHF